MLFLELKSAKGKLRKEQKALKMQAEWLGHTIHKVKSYKGFLEIAHGSPDRY